MKIENTTETLKERADRYRGEAQRARDGLAELIAAMRDMAAFIEWAQDNDKMELIAPTLGHDVKGLLANESRFSPRSFGYALKIGGAK